MEFHSSPPLTLLPHSSAMPREIQLPPIREFIPTLLETNIIREVPPDEPRFFSPLFIVPKKDGPNRLIIDLSILNTFLVVHKFRMERIQSIASCIVSPMWGLTIDLSNAFYHVPIHWSFHRFLAFTVDSRLYVFQFLPFGLALAPWAFNRITKPIKAHLHNRLFRFHTYLDDFFLLDLSIETLREKLSYVLSLLEGLGIQVNFKKSNLVPSQTVEYLGVIFHLDSLRLSLTQEKVSKIQALCNPISITSSRSRRHLGSLVGLLNLEVPSFR